VRLHGRNQATWNVKSAASSSRFDYWYSQEELAGIVPDIRKIAAKTASVHVIFNTNNEDQGQVNARALAQLMR